MRKNRLAIVSYSLASLAGVCFVSGLAILVSERGMHDGEIGSYIVNA